MKNAIKTSVIVLIMLSVSSEVARANELSSKRIEVVTDVVDRIVSEEAIDAAENVARRYLAEKAEERLVENFADAAYKVLMAISAKFDELSRSSFSEFGKANRKDIDETTRKNLQSYFSKLSNKYKNEAKGIKKLAGRTKEFIGKYGSWFTLAGKQVYVEIKLSEEIEKIKQEFPGIEIDERTFIDVARSYVAGIAPDLAILGAAKAAEKTSEMLRKVKVRVPKVRVPKAGIFAIKEILTPEKIAIEPQQPMPSNPKDVVKWVKAMEDWVDRLASENPSWSEEISEKNPPPVGILQYLKLKRDEDKKVLAGFGVTSEKYSRVDEYPWVDKWDVEFNSAKKLTTAKAVYKGEDEGSSVQDYQDYFEYKGVYKWKPSEVLADLIKTGTSVGLTPERKAALIEHNDKIAEKNLSKDFADKVTDTTKTIETIRKLELDRKLAKFDVDIFFLADNTGSMGGLIGSAQANAQAILDGIRSDSRFSKVNAQFGVGMYLGDPSEVGETATTAYQLLQPITNDDAKITAAIDKWYASGGGDWEEANFYAIHQVITEGKAVPRNSSLASNQVTGWRSGAEKVIVVFGDAPSWQNSVNEKELKELIKLTGAKVVFIDTSDINIGQEQNVYDAATGSQMQDAAIEIADASGGSYMLLTDVDKIKDAVLDSVYDAIADNKWTGGMLARVDSSTRWRLRTPSSVTAVSDNGGGTLNFTLSYPNQIDSNFTVDTTTAAKVAGHEYYEGTITDATAIFGKDMSENSVFHTNLAQDFYRFVLRGSGGELEGYYGERLSATSNLANSGVSTYDMRQRVISPYGNQISYSTEGMKLFVNWSSGKVYAFENDAKLDSQYGTSIFIGDIDRDRLEIGGKYVLKTRRLSAAENSELPRFVTDARRDTTTLQFYGSNFANGIGGTFGATYYDEYKTPALSSMLMSGFLNGKNVTVGYSPSNNEVWKGYAVGLVADRSTGAVEVASNFNPDDVQITLRPASATAKADIKVSNSGTYSLATDWTDTSVYVNKDAFAVVKEVDGVPAYAVTTMTEDDGYNYLAWGVWSTETVGTPNKTVLDGSHWIAGRLTPTVDMPTTGTATYSGQVRGMASESGGVHSLNGTINLNANFETGNITGQLDIRYAATGAAYAVTNLSGVSISGNSFAGSLSGSNNTGAINGSFYGPAANEVGGNWEVNKTGSSAAGVFSGKR